MAIYNIDHHHNNDYSWIIRGYIQINNIINNIKNDLLNFLIVQCGRSR